MTGRSSGRVKPGPRGVSVDGGSPKRREGSNPMVLGNLGLEGRTNQSTGDEGQLPPLLQRRGGIA